MIIRLETSSAAFVSYATIHDMKPAPEILFWGERVFVLEPQRIDGSGRGGLRHIYTEGVIAVVPDPTPRSEP